MIFKPELVDRILAGAKTQTRRPVKRTSQVNGSMEIPCRYEVGKTYAVQPGRGKKAVGRLRVTKVRRERWCDIAEEDAIAEGFKREHCYGKGMRSARWWFLEYVKALYAGLDLEAECWVIEFEIVTPVRLPGDDGMGG